MLKFLRVQNFAKKANQINLLSKHTQKYFDINKWTLHDVKNKNVVFIEKKDPKILILF